jgi:hypothetical protein
LLALLKILEQEPKARKAKTKKPVAPKVIPPKPEVPATAPVKTVLASRQVWIIGGLFLLLLGAWGIGKLVLVPNKPESRDLRAQLVLRPDHIPLPAVGKAQLQVGEYLSQSTLPIPENGRLYFRDVIINQPTDSVQLLVSDLPYPGKIVAQSAPNYKGLDSITFYYAVELIELAGRVVYPNLKPVAGIELELENGLARGMTDKDGNFRIQMPRLEKESVNVVYRRNGKTFLKQTRGLYQQVFKELKIPY